MKTIIDPSNLINVQNFTIARQATVTFSGKAINKGKMEVDMVSLYLADASIGSPATTTTTDQLTLVALKNISVKNSTFANIATSMSLHAAYIDILTGSQLKYHTTLTLSGWHRIEIEGKIQQNDQNPGMLSEDQSMVTIYAGNPFNESLKYSYDSTKFFKIGEEAIIRAQKILLFSDSMVTINGRIENSLEEEDGLVVMGTCLLKNDIKSDVFRCVNDYTNYSMLTNEHLIQAYNNQTTGTPVTEISELFDRIPEDYSTYLQSTDTIIHNGTIWGSRLGL